MKFKIGGAKMERDSMLTLQSLKDMKPQTMFAQGKSIDSPEGINMTNSGKMLRWVAVRGGIHDWAIYTHFAYKDVEWIRRCGDKVHSKENIKKLCPCDDEAFSMYRY